jgi:cardiolipin synthase
MARKRARHGLCRQEAGPGRESSDLHVKSGRKPGNAELSIPNIITLGRILLVPFIVWAIASDKMEIAFVIFIVSIYVALGIWGAVPRWIVILVVSRDIMIVAAVIVSWLFGKPIPMKPLMVSKLNTVAQVAFAALVLAALGFGFKSTPYDLILMGFVTVFTLVSVSLYLVEWVRHMSTIEAS